MNANIINMLRTPFELIKDKIKSTGNLTSAELELLPQKWEVFGEVVVIKPDLKLKKYWHDIAAVYANVLGAKAILRRVERISGIYREPRVDLLWGLKTETVHKENKVIFKFDPMQVMFSSGNIDERIRISTMASANETIVDMFSGIGYFSLPIAVHSKPTKIIACELNPTAYDYLCQNILLNKVDNVIEPILGDCREAIQEGVADRIIMGFIKTEHSHRHAAFRILKPSGGIIHFHDVGFVDEALELAYNKITQSLKISKFDKQFRVEIINYYKIKSYGPRLLHVVLDIELLPI
jgi:tRNA wybutosine-synthesizing protein 2